MDRDKPPAEGGAQPYVDGAQPYVRDDLQRFTIIHYVCNIYAYPVPRSTPTTWKGRLAVGTTETSNLAASLIQLPSFLLSIHANRS
jgi:hypothetical protein